MQHKHEKIFILFFREAELGNWQNFHIEEISKKLKMKLEDLKTLIPNKNHFLKFYNSKVDEEVIKGISEDELKISSSDEIIQEYFMSKLEIMAKYKFAFINILNNSIKDPGFILINLKSNTDSINKFLNKVSKKEKDINRIVLTKLLLGVWILAFNKWLYEEDNDELWLATVNKGINKIKKNTNLFSKI